jgi:deferrochelatase/peroxidase EfeB
LVRKLEQNVKLFKQSVQELASSLNVSPDLAGALAICRFQNGSPLSEADQATDQTGNDFNVAADPEGSRCPFHAHVRKTNPRGDSVREFNMSEAEERAHRIVRRAVSYGSHQLRDEPEKDSGLLFLCFQASIENQFNFIQSRWANASKFLRVGVGPVPLIGQPPGRQTWPLGWGEKQSRSAGFPLAVSLKGGDYLFAPSISFLCSLAR